MWILPGGDKHVFQTLGAACYTEKTLLALQQELWDTIRDSGCITQTHGPWTNCDPEQWCTPWKVGPYQSKWWPDGIACNQPTSACHFHPLWSKLWLLWRPSHGMYYSGIKSSTIWTPSTAVTDSLCTCRARYTRTVQIGSLTKWLAGIQCSCPFAENPFTLPS